MRKCEYLEQRVASLLARGRCATCGKRPLASKYRCDECRKKHNRQQTFYNRFHGVVRQYSDEYYRAKGEREVVSWAWSHPARRKQWELS